MDEEQQLVTAVTTALSNLEFDVAQRNEYMNTREHYIYGEGLFSRLDIADGADRTMYNYLKRVVDIHTAQLFGRGVGLYSDYNKEDIEPVENDPKQLELVRLRNKKRQALSDMRNKAWAAIVRDNGGDALFENGAQLCSANGWSAYKLYRNTKEKKVVIKLLENAQNYRAGWSGNDFRERDFDAYVYQISVQRANREYGDKLAEGEEFSTSKEGSPFSMSGGDTSDPVNQMTNSPDKRQETDVDMVTVIELTGTLPKRGVKDKKVVEVTRGKEEPFNVLIVGGKLVQTITDKDKLPRYYMVPNSFQPRRAWPEGDISQSLIEINETIVQLMSDEITWANKNLFKFIQAKGFVPENVPVKKQRKSQVIPMGLDQSLEEMGVTLQPLTEFKQLIDQLTKHFLVIAGIPPAQFFDSTIDANSNQALMTLMKPLIDIVTRKQKLWTPILVEIAEEALYLASKDTPELKEAVEEPGWKFTVEWPSILHREDQTYQQMLLNWANYGLYSPETLLKKLGEADPSEEQDRVRDAMRDKVTAAQMGRQLPLLAQQAITPPGPAQPDVKVSLRGDLTPYQEANIASTQGFNDGPFPPTAGPQGNQGLVAQENADNGQFLTNDPFKGGQPIQRGQQGEVVQSGNPYQAPNPTLTPGDNTGQTASQPGSGAPAVSPEGAIAQINQRQGR